MCTNPPSRPVVRLVQVAIIGDSDRNRRLAGEVESLGADVMISRDDDQSVANVVDLRPDAIVFAPAPPMPDDPSRGPALMVEAARQAIPILAVGMGYLMVAIAFGGRIKILRRPIPTAVLSASHTGVGVVAGVAGPIVAMTTHSQYAVWDSLPGDLMVTAVTAGLPFGFAHRSLPIHAIRYHPMSIIADQRTSILTVFLGLAKGKRLLRP